MARAGGILGLTAMLFLAGCTSAGRTNNQKSESSGGTWATGSWFAWETNETHDAYVLDFSLAAPTNGAMPACELFLGVTMRGRGPGIQTFRVDWAGGEIVGNGVSSSGSGRLKAAGFDSDDVLQPARDFVYGYPREYDPKTETIPANRLFDLVKEGPVRYVFAARWIEAGPTAGSSFSGAERMDNRSAAAELKCDGDVRYQFEHTSEVILGNQEDFEEATMVVAPSWTAGAQKGTLRASFSGPHVDVLGHSFTSFSDRPAEAGSFTVRGPAGEKVFQLPFSVRAVQVQGGPGAYELELDRVAVTGKGKCAPYCADLFATLAFARTTPLPAM